MTAPGLTRGGKRVRTIEVFRGLKEGLRAVQGLARSSRPDRVVRGTLGKVSRTYAVASSPCYATCRSSQTQAYERHQERDPRHSFRNRMEDREIFASATRQPRDPSCFADLCVCDDATLACCIRRSVCGTPRVIYERLLWRNLASSIACCCSALRQKTFGCSADNLSERKTSDLDSRAHMSLPSRHQSRTADLAASSEALCHIRGTELSRLSLVGGSTW